MARIDPYLETSPEDENTFLADEWLDFFSRDPRPGTSERQADAELSPPRLVSGGDDD